VPKIFFARLPNIPTTFQSGDGPAAIW